MTAAQVFTMSVKDSPPTPVRISVEIDTGTASTDSVATEVRDRVRAALSNTAPGYPAGAVGISYSRNYFGSGSDLALAVAITQAASADPAGWLDRTVFLGELGLDGTLRPVPGLAAAVAAVSADAFDQVVVPAAIIGDITGHSVPVIPASTLAEALAWLHGQRAIAALLPAGPMPATAIDTVRTWHRVFEIAAAGGHSMALTLPPHTPTTLLARHLRGLLPTPTDAETIARRAAIGSDYRDDSRTHGQAPFTTVHYSTPQTAFLGGLRTPGVLPRAHGGLLFIDDYPLLSLACWQAFRVVLDQHAVTLAVGDRMVSRPARLQLLLTAYDCAGHHWPGSRCDCRTDATARYQRYRDHLPLLTPRIEIRSAPTALTVVGDIPTLTEARGRVVLARAAARERWSRLDAGCNAVVPPTAWAEQLDRGGPLVRLLVRLIERGEFSRRDACAVLSVAWTLADLRGDSAPTRDDVELAVRLHRPPRVSHR